MLRRHQQFLQLLPGSKVFFFFPPPLFQQLLLLLLAVTWTLGRTRSPHSPHRQGEALGLEWKSLCWETCEVRSSCVASRCRRQQVSAISACCKDTVPLGHGLPRAQPSQPPPAPQYNPHLCLSSTTPGLPVLCLHPEQLPPQLQREAAQQFHTPEITVKRCVGALVGVQMLG